MARFVSRMQEGLRFGSLVAVRKVTSVGERRCKWECICDCGKTKIVDVSNLNNGSTKSCGCMTSKWIRDSKMKHGSKETPEYQSWRLMRERCFGDPKKYKNYSGRGIKVCERWNDFLNFLADMGPKPSKKHSIDRIDNNGDYEPSNCRWATMAQQNNNKRNTVYLEYNGERKSLAEWAKSLCMDRVLLWVRLFKLGWNVDRTLTEPVGVCNHGGKKA